MLFPRREAASDEMLSLEQQQRMDACFKQVFEDLGSDFDWERNCSAAKCRSIPQTTPPAGPWAP